MKWLLLFLVPVLLGAGPSPQAEVLRPLFLEVQKQHWNACSLPWTMAGQVEQESNWKTKATLKTSRELGRGLGQLTITYKQDGSERFNTYRDAVRMRALKGWDWQQDPYHARFQLTYLVITDRSHFAVIRPQFGNDKEASAAVLVAYNAGFGTVLKRIAAARQAGQARPYLWFGGLDQVRSPGEGVLLYGKDLGDTRNEYPRKVLQKAEKYRPWWSIEN